MAKALHTNMQCTQQKGLDHNLNAKLKIVMF
jgi:hypothetical protein